MPVDKPAPEHAAASSDRVALRTLRERRRRVIRNALGVVGVAILLILLTALNRDRQARESCAQRMKQAVKMLQEDHQRWLSSPGRFPLERVRATLGPPWSRHVFENSRFTELAAYASTVGVCCCVAAHHRPFQSRIRYVIVFNVREETYELKTMEEQEFVRRAEELGLRGVLLSR